jgi:hypothetical protein
MFRKTNPSGRFALLAVLLLFGACPVFGAGFKQLHGHVPEASKRLTSTGRLAATNELHLAIGVPLRDAVGLDGFLADVYDSASANYRHFLTPTEFTARFSATAADYAAVKNFARTNGFKISGEHGNRLLLDVTAKVADVERAFNFKLNKFKHPTENREFFAPDAEPTVDVALAIVDIQGLSDYARPHPKLHKMDSKTFAPKNGSAPDGSSYFGDDFRNAYAPGAPLTGAGQQVGLLQFDGYYASDIAAYAAAAGGGRTNIIIQTVLTDSYDGTPTTGVTSGNGEVSLDIEMAMAMAPGLSKIVVFEADPNSGNANTVFAAMVTNTAIKQFSCSWGWSGGANTTTENYFKQMASQGQSFFNASGDSDAFLAGQIDDSTQTTYPSGSPNITQVGGTTLTMNGTGASYASETVWNWGLHNGSYVGSSGGISSNTIPVWQQGISMTANGGSTTTRNVPDVALTADSCYVKYGNGSSSSFGGTSCAAPLWAGFMALVNQQAVVDGKPSPGFCNTAIYELARSSSYNSVFHDTIIGNNTWPSSPNQFYAVPGYDLCTGLGTPAGTNLINALVNPDSLVVISNAGFSASGKFGGPFSPSSQNFVLTNSSATSLDWVILTPSWLSTSVTNGTLTAGTSTSVTLSVSAAATNLPPAVYTGNVWFSNVTAQVAHSRLFGLQVTDLLLLLTTNGFTAYGPAGGPIYPATQSLAFTNLGTNVISWSLINTSSWLSVSANSGSISANSSVSVTVTTNNGVMNLTAGNYSATLVLSNNASHVTQNVTFTALIETSIVQNGGFETGDFSNWTLVGNTVSGNTAYNAVESLSAYPDVVHTGNYGAFLGDIQLATLTQSLPTAIGQSYLLSFWVSNRTGGSNEKFKVYWNNNLIYNLSNPSSFALTNQKFVVTATGTNTTLQFAVQNNPDHFGLDDVTVTPVSAPSIIQQPVSQTNLVGSNVVFTLMANGTIPLSYQWRTNGVKLANNTVVSGATSNILTLTSITATNGGNYTLVVTNAYGFATSSVAILAVASPPSFTGNLTNRTIECGANTNNFSIITAGTPPLGIQWKLNSSPVAGATNASFGITNLFYPAPGGSNYTVIVIVTNLYGSVSSNVTLTVQDTRPPVITILGANPLTNELGSVFIDPGATASDTCSGLVFISTNGAVNVSVVGTNILKYIAADGGNSATNTRTVIVRDTTPPTILWSFTNLIMAANSNCVALMTNVTGTNFIIATDLSGALTISQSLTNNATLPLGTNLVVLTVADASGNKSYSTNRIVVQDQTPPLILSQPQSQTNFIGTTATFSVFATACTPLTFQWYSNNTLTIFTNSTLTLSNLADSATGNYFAVANAGGGSSTSLVATLTVNLLPPAISVTTLNFNSGFNLNLSGSPSHTYILEAATNLLPIGNWLPVATNTLGTNGVWSFTDASATNFPFQFYRLKFAQ